MLLVLKLNGGAHFKKKLSISCTNQKVIIISINFLVAEAEVIVPPGLEVKESNIPKAGRGVFAKCVIPKHDFFGPFVGKKVTAEEAKNYKDSPYVWEVRLFSVKCYFLMINFCLRQSKCF